jgi:hypothetical protein
MRKSLFLVLAAALASTCAFAVDGVVLINQSTVMAAGGFPYTITQPGSYRLSGNLTAPVNSTAIQISSSNVSLDLNGFTISCPFTLQVICVTDFALTKFRKIAIRNGVIDVSQIGAEEATNTVGLFVASSNAIVEELQVEIHSGTLFFGASLTPLVSGGINSIVRHNILRADFNGNVFGAAQIACPSLILENVGGISPIGSTCVSVNNNPGN